MSPCVLIKRSAQVAEKNVLLSYSLLLSKVWRTAVTWPCIQASLRGW